MGSALYIMFWSVKCTFTWQRRLFKSVNIDVFFLHKVRKHLVHNMFSFQFDSNLAPIPWAMTSLKCLNWLGSFAWTP